MKRGWIGVDLDGTLAMDVSRAPEVIGPPVERMLERVKAWLKDGRDVRIMTARVSCSGERNSEGTIDDDKFAEWQRHLIEEWSLAHIGQIIPITASKDFMMAALYDDRAVQIIKNDGRTVLDFLDIEPGMIPDIERYHQ